MVETRKKCWARYRHSCKLTSGVTEGEKVSLGDGLKWSSACQSLKPSHCPKLSCELWAWWYGNCVNIAVICQKSDEIYHLCWLCTKIFFLFFKDQSETPGRRGLVKPLRMGSGTHSQSACCQLFPAAFLLICRCLSPLLLLISTRWSYSNTALVAAPGEQYATAYFILFPWQYFWSG